MSNVKICLRRGYHSVYDELVNYPPSGVKYVIPKFVTPSKSGVTNLVKRKIWRAYTHFVGKPNSIRVKCEGTDLIHSGGGFLIENNSPWVVDLEQAASTVGFEAGRLDKVSHVVEKFFASDNCKKIMPWTKAGQTSVLNAFNTSKFRDKLKVVYPAMHLSKKTPHKAGDKIRMLFVSTRFFTKGGKELLEAYDILRKKHDVSLTVISDVPNNLKSRHPDINFLQPNVPRSELLKKYYPNTDIFILPSYMDTFGIVFLEAMSLSIPIVSSNCFAIPEIVENAGLLVDVSKYSWYDKKQLFAWNSWEKFSEYVEKTNKPEIVGQLVKKTSDLIEDSSLRKKMGRAGRKKIENGKFSIKERNNNLKNVYEEVVEES